MLSHEFAESILQFKKEKQKRKIEDETSVCDVATLISGQFIIPLFFKLQQFGFDMILLKQHLEFLYDSDNHFGLVYFIFILAEAADMKVPFTFTKMCANDAFAPILSGAIIDEWLNLDFTADYYDE